MLAHPIRELLAGVTEESGLVNPGSETIKRNE